MPDRDWDGMIDKVIGTTFRLRYSNLIESEVSKARTALREAIAEVERELAEAESIIDVPEGQKSAFYSCDKCGSYIPRVSSLEHQLKAVRNELVWAEQDAERLASKPIQLISQNKSVCKFCRGIGTSTTINHRVDCAFKIYEGHRLARKEGMK